MRCEAERFSHSLYSVPACELPPNSQARKSRRVRARQALNRRALNRRSLNRRSLNRVILFLAVVLSQFFSVSELLAQRGGTAIRNQASQLQSAGNAVTGGLETVEMEGTLEAIAGERLKIKTSDDTDVFVVLTAKTKVRYGAIADAKFLRAGLMVRFDSEFDTQQGISVNPIDVIEVFQPSRGRRLTMEERKDQTAGIYPISEEKKAEGKNTSARRSAKQEKTQRDQKIKDKPENSKAQNAEMKNDVDPAAVKPFRVVGQLQVIQDSKLRVIAGRQAIVVDLADDVQVQVVAGDALFCQPGDKVKLAGLRSAAQPNLVQAAEVEIVGKQPLGSSNDGGQNAGTQQASPKNNSGKSLSRRRTRGKLGEDD